MVAIATIFYLKLDLEIIDEDLASSKTTTISILDYEEAQKLNDLLYKGSFDEVLFKIGYYNKNSIFNTFDIKKYESKFF